MLAYWQLQVTKVGPSVSPKHCKLSWPCCFVSCLWAKREAEFPPTNGPVGFFVLRLNNKEANHEAPLKVQDEALLASCQGSEWRHQRIDLIKCLEPFPPFSGALRANSRGRSPDWGGGGGAVILSKVMLPLKTCWAETEQRDRRSSQKHQVLSYPHTA